MSKFNHLIDLIQSDKYQYIEQPYILNHSNEDLFTGPNNLKQPGKIHDARIFSKFIYTQLELEQLTEQRVLFVESGTDGVGVGVGVGRGVNGINGSDSVNGSGNSIGMVGDDYGGGGGGGVDFVSAVGSKPNTAVPDVMQQVQQQPISNHLLGFFTLGKLMTSHLNIVHGGAIATLIDEFFVKAALPLTPANFAVTANLNIKYSKPLKFQPGQDYLQVLLDCFILESKNNQKFKVVGSLKTSDGQTRYCYGDVLVVVPRIPLDEM